MAHPLCRISVVEGLIMVDQAVHIGGGHASSASEALTAVEAHAKAWKAGGRRNSDLYDADRLDAVAQTCDDESTLSGDVRDFLAQSRGHLAGRRSARRLGVAIGGVATVIAVVAGVSVAVDDDAGPLSDVGAALERVAALQTTDTTQSAQLAAAVAAAHPDDPRAVAALRDTQSDAVRRDLDTVAARAVSVATTGRAALAGRDGAVRIVDRGAVVATVPAAPGDQTVTAAVDTRGLRLVTSGADGAVRVWSIAGDGSSNPVGALPATGRATTAIALAADRPWAFAADATGAIRVLSLANPARPALLATIPGDGRAVTTLAADPTRAVIATGGPSRPLGVLDVSTPSSPTTIATPGGTAALRGAAFAADGASAVTTDESGSAQLWSVDDTGITPVGAPIDPPSPGGADAAFSPDGTRLAITATSGAIALVDVSRSATPRTLSRTARLTGRGLIASAFTGENELISVTSGAPVAWTLPTGLLTGGFGTPTAASCATTRTYCASGFLRGPVRVFERGSATDIDQIGEIDAPDHFDGASMSPDGRWMMTVDARHLAQLWDVTTIGRPVAVGPARSLGPQQDNHLVFSPDSTRLVTGFGSAQTVRVWRVTARGLVPAGDVTPPQAGAVTAVAFTPDSRGLILGTDADRVVSARLTDTTATVDGPTRTVDGPVTAVAAVGDGVVAGDRLGGLYHFPNDSSRPRSTVDVGNASVGTVLADGPDAVLVAAGDGTLRRWTMGDDMVTLGSPGDPGDTTTGLLRMARTQGSGVLLTGNDGLTRAWDLDAAAARTRLCAAAPALVDPQTPGSCA